MPKLQKVLYGTNIKPARPNNQEQPQRIELGRPRVGAYGAACVRKACSNT